MAFIYIEATFGNLESCINDEIITTIKIACQIPQGDFFATTMIFNAFKEHIETK